jgi:prophage regulatory protein
MSKQHAIIVYLRKPKVLDITGWSPATLYRQEKSGNFPKRYRLSKNAVGWRSDQVETWVLSRQPVSQEDL